MLVLQGRIRADSEVEAVRKILERHEGWELACLKVAMRAIDERGNWFEYMVTKEGGDGTTRPNKEDTD